MAALDFLSLPSGLAWAVAACALSAAAAGSVGYGLGDRQAAAAGAADLADLKREHAEQAVANGQRNLDDLLSEMRRANDAEAQLINAKAQHQTELEQLQERIPNVTTVYLPAPASKPVAIPRCVFTAGWLRDYNAALGVPAAVQGTTAGHPQAATSPAPGTDAELLESRVTPADILAHAQDYGMWARNNLAQLNAVLDLQEKD
ncbi:lysis protein [Pseudomonas sp. zfem002]|uniref:lysis protein n=1 Tax=Pseudomonas sp. zfem002 TaxID=3078197 RepID=UPI002927B293|nr:lysis protein [Pseudomonas sp. zfem002]MDU9392131.1 lysis protein [Pseudomonas sp. zfem002]